MIIIITIEFYLRRKTSKSFLLLALLTVYKNKIQFFINIDFNNAYFHMALDLVI